MLSLFILFFTIISWLQKVLLFLESRSGAIVLLCYTFLVKADKIKMFCLVRLDGQTKAEKMKVGKIDLFDRELKKFFEQLQASEKNFFNSEILRSFKISANLFGGLTQSDWKSVKKRILIEIERNRELKSFRDSPRMLNRGAINTIY